MRVAVVGWRRADFDIIAPVPWACSHIGGWMSEHLEQIYHVCEDRSRIAACGVEADAKKLGVGPISCRADFAPAPSSKITYVWTYVMICVEINFPPASICIHSVHVWTYL